MRRHRISIISLLLILCCAMFFTACSCNGGNNDTGKISEPKELYISPENLTLDIGDEYTLNLSNPQSLSTTWFSDRWMLSCW